MNKINICGHIWRRNLNPSIIRQQVRLLHHVIKLDKLPDFIANDTRPGNQILAGYITKYLENKVILTIVSCCMAYYVYEYPFYG